MWTRYGYPCVLPTAVGLRKKTRSTARIADDFSYKRCGATG